MADGQPRGVFGRRRRRPRLRQRRRQRRRRSRWESAFERQKQKRRRDQPRRHDRWSPHTLGESLPKSGRRGHVRRDALRPSQVVDAGPLLGQPAERRARDRGHGGRDAPAQVLPPGHSRSPPAHGGRPGLCLPPRTGNQEPDPPRPDCRRLRPAGHAGRRPGLRRPGAEPRNPGQRPQTEPTPVPGAGPGTPDPAVHAPDRAARDEQHRPAASAQGTNAAARKGGIGAVVVVVLNDSKHTAPHRTAPLPGTIRQRQRQRQ
mmetsp:Transcript_16225/g.33722  ORF Transcript_16225/g.33722 Transcript_16225/m.33722 type:complete len:260 (-) Transcript_16225:2169-2948(-)